MEITLFYITYPDKKTAERISALCVNKKLAACTNLFPIESCFTWADEYQQENEWVSIIKTLPSKIEQISSIIQSEHPYEVPCIIHYPVQVNPTYGAWVQSCVSSD